MIFGSKKRLKEKAQVGIDRAISVGDFEIKRVVTTKSLGPMLDESLYDKNAIFFVFPCVIEVDIIYSV